MDVQQIVTWILVAVASVYLARLGYASWKAMWSGRAGCGSGCAKCISAEIASHRHARGADSSRQTSNVIPLAAVHRAPSKRDE